MQLGADEVQNAHRYFEAGGIQGKVGVEIAPL